MSERKVRVTVTLDRALLDVANQAVRAGESRSLSSWVNRALADRADHERRQRAMGEAIAMYEAEFGELTDEQMEANVRRLRATAIKIRAAPRPKPAKRRTARGT